MNLDITKERLVILQWLIEVGACNDPLTNHVDVELISDEVLMSVSLSSKLQVNLMERINENTTFFTFLLSILYADTTS